MYSSSSSSRSIRWPSASSMLPLSFIVELLSSSKEARAVRENLRLRAFRHVLACAEKRNRVEHAMSMRQVRRVENAVVADCLRHHADPRFVELAAEVDAPRAHVVARVARRQVGLLRATGRLLVEALHPVEPVRHPFDAGFEEAHLQARKAPQHAADQYAREAHEDRQ